MPCPCPDRLQDAAAGRPAGPVRGCPQARAQAVRSRQQALGVVAETELCRLETGVRPRSRRRSEGQQNQEASGHSRQAGRTALTRAGQGGGGRAVLPEPSPSSTPVPSAGPRPAEGRPGLCPRQSSVEAAAPRAPRPKCLHRQPVCREATRRPSQLELLWAGRVGGPAPLGPCVGFVWRFQSHPQGLGDMQGCGVLPPSPVQGEQERTTRVQRVNYPAC